MGDPLVLREKPLAGKTIIVNPGHGCMKWVHKGKKSVYELDTGAKTKADGKTVYEMKLNDKVAQNIATKLTDLGANVIYADNMPIGEIKALENAVKPDLFIAIHHDAKEKGGKHNYGETIFADGEKSLKAANFINKRLMEDKTIPNNKINMNPNEAKKLVVLQADKSIPAVLTEIGHMTNPNELKILMTDAYQDKAAQNIVDGIEDYFAGDKKTSQFEIFLKNVDQPFNFNPPQLKYHGPYKQ